MEINWQGAIAEVLLAELYPDLELSQPYVVESSNTRESDFIYKEQGIEVKCNRFYRIYPRYFVNKERFNKKRDLASFLIACAINEEPLKATKFYLFGYIQTSKIPEYPVETRHSSPAYSIPIKDFQDLNGLFRSFSLANYMGASH